MRKLTYLAVDDLTRIIAISSIPRDFLDSLDGVERIRKSFSGYFIAWLELHGK